MPASGRSGREEYLAGPYPRRALPRHRCGRRHEQPSPHMLPSAADFGRRCSDLGVGRDARIIVYDNSPPRNASRGWFMLRHFGAEQVAILDGGLANGLPKAGRPKAASPALRPGRSSMRSSGPAKSSAGATSSTASAFHLVDARSRARFDRHGSRPPPERRLRAISPVRQLAVRRALQRRRHLQVARRNPAFSPQPAPTRTSRSSPVAVRASPPTA